MVNVNLQVGARDVCQFVCKREIWNCCRKAIAREFSLRVHSVFFVSSYEYTGHIIFCERVGEVSMKMSLIKHGNVAHLMNVVTTAVKGGVKRTDHERIISLL